ncbi:MAG: hypothetical protein OXG67_01585 [bacterium]|nr:hypothetical protein [bacterium]
MTMKQRGRTANRLITFCLCIGTSTCLIYPLRFFESRVATGYALLSALGVVFLLLVLAVAVSAAVNIRCAQQSGGRR